jgi:hypothetical protein
MNEILQYLEMHGERLDTEIAHATGIALSNVRLHLLELAAKRTIMACRSIKFVKGNKIEEISCRLPSERKIQLEKMAELTWNPRYDAWGHGYKEIVEYSKITGNSQVPIKYITSTGFKLGNWVGEQRLKRHKLSKDQEGRLEALPEWTWNTIHNQWETGFNSLIEFIRREGHGRVHARYVTPEGYRLGNWVNTQRTKRLVMSKDRVERLEALPEWIWSAKAKD